VNDKQHYTVTLEADTNEPALTGAVFDILRVHARACDLPDIGHISVNLTVECAGFTCPRRIEELRARLDALWLGQVSKVEVHERPDRAG
jgi:hypothetical protein